MRDQVTSIEYPQTLSAAGRSAGWWQERRGAFVGIVGLLLCGYLLAQIATRLDMFFAIAGVVCLVVGVVVARNPQFGIFGLFLIAPFTVGGSPEVASQNSDYSAGLLPSEMMLGFLLLIWAGRMFLTGKWKLVPSDLNKPMFALAGVVLASLACAQIVYDPTIPVVHHLLITQAAEAGMFLLAIGAFLLASNTLVTRKWLSALFYPVLFVGVYTSVSKLADLPTIVPIGWAPLITSIAAAYVLARLLFSSTKGWAKAGLVVALIVFVAVPCTSLGWISGLLAISATLMTLVLLKSRKAFVWLAVALLLFAVVSRPFLSGMYQTSEDQGDFDRFGIWSDAAHMALDTNPILGIGPGNFYPYSFRFGSIWYGRYTYTTAHNNYAQIVAEMGLLGLAVLFWLLFAGIKTGVKLFREARTDLKWIPAAATAIFVGFAASSVLGDYMFPNRANGGLFHFGISVYIWLTLGAAVAASRVPSDESSQEETGGAVR
jgi:O-antigen ligase